MSKSPSKFNDVLEALENYNQPFPNRLMRDFSDLTPVNLHELKNFWPSIKTERKVSLLEDLENIAESDTLVSFDEFAKYTLTDPDPAVRVLSIRLLWECEDPRLITTFTEMMLSDNEEDVRAAAASAMGKYVLLGELDSITESLRISSVQNLIDVVKGDDLPMVRRRALESLGYSSHPKVADLILQATEQKDSQWMTSALYAIARSADDKWSNIVINHLDSKDSEVLFEAIRAAGELELEDARDTLLEKLDEITDDEDLRLAVIWSLSQIGGDVVKKKFEDLAEKCTDEEEAEWLDKAIDNLELGQPLENMGMIDFEADKLTFESDDLSDYEDLDENEEDDDEDEDYVDFDELELSEGEEEE
jgi:hypothetical protein